MNKKDKLIKAIKGAKVADGFKAELVDFVESAENCGPETIKDVQAKIDQYAYDIIDQIADMEMEDALADFNKEIAAIEKDVDQFEADLNQKADEIDTAALRNEIK